MSRESSPEDTSKAVREHRASAPDVLGFGVVTASDSRSLEDDASGDLIQRRLEEAGHRVEERVVVPDQPAELRRAVRGLLAREEVDGILVTGGTGFSPRDVTVDAIVPLFELEIPGFGELFRMLSYAQVGSAAMLSRATAGLAQGRAVFLLPGSPKAVELALDELILPETGHLLGVARR